jgi:hypothetical protein
MSIASAEAFNQRPEEMGFFSDQLGKQRSDFIYQYNQQAQEFDAQLASQESRYESVLQQENCAWPLRGWPMDADQL